MASIRQEPPYSPPYSPEPLSPANSERGDSKMSGPSAQRFPPKLNHMRSVSTSSSISNKGNETNREQYESLRVYLADHIAKENQTGTNVQRGTARERLQRLTKTQFFELSTDVFDELTRRNTNDPNMPFLPSQNEFQAKRNQARQKLATLPESRFKDLASDIFFDMDRRYPELREPKTSSEFQLPPLPPIPSLDSTPYPMRKDSAPANGLTNTTTIVPTKSTITYEPVNYTIQTGVPSLPPAYRTDSATSARTKDSAGYDRNGSPLPPASSNNNRTLNGMSTASNSSIYTISSVRSGPRDRRDTTQSEKDKPALPRAPMPNGAANGAASPANSSPTLSPVNFQNLDSLMADLGNMIINKTNGSQPPSPVAELPDGPKSSKLPNGSTPNDYGDRERDRLEMLRNSSSKEGHERDASDKRSQLPKPNINEEFAKMKEEYEGSIAVMKKRLAQLEAESEEKLNKKSDLHRDQGLEDEVNEYKKLNQSQTLQLAQLQERLDRVNEDYQKMEEDYRSQQQVVNDVRTETTLLLEEIKELSNQTDELTVEKDQAVEKLRVVQGESKTWQAKYEKTKIELRNLKATSSFVREPPKLDVFSENQLRPTPNGAVEQARVTEYQASIDDLLRAGRSETPSSVLLAMKSIVLACKLITEDVESSEANPSTEDKPGSKEVLYSLKAKFSSTLTNLMTAAKAHATGMGISPVSLLDAAASHLTVSVIDIVKFVGMRKSQPEDEERRREDKYRRKGSVASVKSNNSGYANSVNDDRGANSNGSKRASLSMGGAWSGKDMGGTFNGKGDADKDGKLQPAELKAYLERQTDTIVQAIQVLLATLRAPSNTGDITPSVSTITSTVTNIISTSRTTFALPQSSPYRLKGEGVLRDLETNVDKLSECQENLKKGQDTKMAKSKLASVSFEIAKFTKELMGIL